MPQRLTLSALKNICAMTERVATPHRVPDFTNLENLVKGDPEINGIVRFIEEHNTGYDGVLERWEFTVDDADTDIGSPIFFSADLIPGSLTNLEPEA